METLPLLLGLLAGVIAGGVAAWLIKSLSDRTRVHSARQQAETIIADARRDAENSRREALLEARDEALAEKQRMELEVEKRFEDLRRQEKKIGDRELSAEKRFDRARQRERELKDRDRNLRKQERTLSDKDEKLNELIAEHEQTLERLAGKSSAEALEELRATLIDRARADSAHIVKEILDEARADANREARELIVQAIQRTAADHTAEMTVSTVDLPNDEIKGRIIGREGRNIRALEAATGVDIIVDDTPETVVVSCFDPVRRELGRMALEKLVADGRIHPGRIEDVVNKAEKELDERIIELGRNAVTEAKVHGLHPELMKALGRMHYRTSYGQNQLRHSVEVAKIMGILAAELGFNAKLARRCGLLHDIGKSIDRESEGTHVQLGAQLAKKHGEPPEVINAILSHHGDTPPDNALSVLAAAADAISGSRPGARRESLESYVQRLHDLEEIAAGFDGVNKVYAIQAGREVRIIVENGKVNDAYADVLARDIAEKIEQELTYPGQIKVTVIREYRASGVAK
ncbi:MAG: Ribonuclease Y [Calditrichaeota bacterium]|nr:Ribonuclease Y [Calditrichota bacterium]